MKILIEVELNAKDATRCESIRSQIEAAVNHETARLYTNNWLQSVSLANAEILQEFLV